MPSLRLPNQLIWFAHCPKAGGTSVERILVDTWGGRVAHLHWGWDLWWRNGGWRHADPPNSPQHLTWADAQQALDRHPSAVFALVRDPVARLASEHRYQRHLRRGSWMGRAIAHLPFSMWLRLMLAVQARHPFAFDNHLRPQSDFVPADAMTFRLEDGMEAPIAWLEAITETRLPAPSRHLETGRPTSPDVDPHDAALIAATYAEDYQRFGYAPLEASPPRKDASRWTGLLAPIVVWLDKRGRL